MTRLLLLFALVMSAPTALAQSTYFVATDGSVLGSGTIESPFPSIDRALEFATAGDTVYVRGGTYASPSPIRIDEGGTEGSYLHVWAYADEEPVFDFTGANRGFDLRGDYVHMKGLTVEHSGANGVFLEDASYNIIEEMVARYNGDSGFQVQRGASHNLLLNNDSYENYDPGTNGENADGFAIKFGVGEGNVLRGNRAWGNSDDGYDFWTIDNPEQQGVLIEGNWAFRNGFNIWDDPGFDGDSNGFKLGKGEGPHTLVRNLAWGHNANGFDVNGNASGVTVYNNTAYFNRGVNFQFDDDPEIDEQALYVLRNNASVAASVRMDASVTDDEFNSWNTAIPSARPEDFVSLDDTGADGPRQPDGSLPDLSGFLRLVEGSDLIDAGVDVGLPYTGAAPDIGAFESPYAVPVEAEATPQTLALHAGYPNPFRSSTHLTFETAEAGPVRLRIYDALGRTVATLVDGDLGAGAHAVTWTAADLAAGLYVARLEAGETSATVSLMHIK
jgi:hypothetical protein